MMRLWARRKFVLPIQKALGQGISIERMAVSLALGITVGLIPFYGLTTILVGAIALSLRLNFLAMQVAHYLVHPIQLVLIIPFFKLGSAVMKGASVSFTVKEYLHLFKADFWGAVQQLWKVNLSAIMVWLIISIPLSLLLYFTLKKLMQRYVVRLVPVRA